MEPIRSHLGTATVTQAINRQPIAPTANLNWPTGGQILTGAVGGAAAVGVARLGAGLASSTTSLVGGAPLAMPGNLTQAIVGGIGAGAGEVAASRPGNFTPNYAPFPFTQSLPSFSVLPSAAGGNCFSCLIYGSGASGGTRIK